MNCDVIYSDINIVSSYCPAQILGIMVHIESNLSLCVYMHFWVKSQYYSMSSPAPCGKYASAHYSQWRKLTHIWNEIWSFSLTSKLWFPNAFPGALKCVGWIWNQFNRPFLISCTVTLPVQPDPLFPRSPVLEWEEVSRAVRGAPGGELPRSPLQPDYFLQTVAPLRFILPGCCARPLRMTNTSLKKESPRQRFHS